MQTISDSERLTMKQINRILIAPLALFVCLVISSTQAWADDDVLKIVFIAYENPDQLISYVDPVVEYL